MSVVQSVRSAPSPAATGAGFLTGLRVFSARSLKKSFRDGESLLMAILLPVFLMLIFTFVMGGAIDVGGGGRQAYLAYVMPAVVPPPDSGPPTRPWWSVRTSPRDS